jgi:hypothetical protein
MVIRRYSVTMRQHPTSEEHVKVKQVLTKLSVRSWRSDHTPSTHNSHISDVFGFSEVTNYFLCVEFGYLK